MDLRRQQRFPVCLHSILSGPRREEWVGTVMNLSKGGCLIEVDGQVYSGMQVSLRLDVPGDTTPILVARAAVRWNRGRGVGLGFITVDQPHQERLNQLLERLRQELQ
ncbi:MAG: PilZ domain-containing protein [Nitrospira sp.]